MADTDTTLPTGNTGGYPPPTSVLTPESLARMSPTARARMLAMMKRKKGPTVQQQNPDDVMPATSVLSPGPY